MYFLWHRSNIQNAGKSTIVLSNSCHGKYSLIFIFVDAENISLKEVESINASLSDKVFVFSKTDAVKSLCERKLFLYISSYPTGANQADFYLIATLSGIIASLSPAQKQICACVLYSRDNSLVAAFTFQCKLHQVNYKVALQPKLPKVVKHVSNVNSLEEKILTLLTTPMKSEAIREQLNVPRTEFTRSLNQLIRDEKIKRSPERQKSWIRTSHSETVE